jgi:hypothetical protein
MGPIQLCNHMSVVMKVMFWCSAPSDHSLVFVSLLLVGELIGGLPPPSPLASFVSIKLVHLLPYDLIVLNIFA